MSARFQVSFTSVAALIKAEKQFLQKTPKRWELIAEYVKKSTDVGSMENAHEPHMILGFSKSLIEFHCSADHCKQLFYVLSASYKHILDYVDQLEEMLFSDSLLAAFKPVILLPRILTCCGHPVSIK